MKIWEEKLGFERWGSVIEKEEENWKQEGGVSGGYKTRGVIL